MVKKFSFSLQSLLSWKEKLEEKSRMDLARRNRQLRRQDEEIQNLTDQREKDDCDLRRRMEQRLFAWEYSVQKEFNEASYQTLAQMAEHKKRIEREVQEERDRLTGLMKERKILERLKEKRRTTFLKELKTIEQKNLDEVATRAYRRGGCLARDTDRAS